MWEVEQNFSGGKENPEFTDLTVETKTCSTWWRVSGNFVLKVGPGEGTIWGEERCLEKNRDWLK